MPSLVFNRAVELWARGSIDFDTDTFRRMLTTSAYVENKDTHDFRDDVTNEVTGTGYTAGGQIVVPTLTLDLTNDRLDITFPSSTWASSTITARKAVVYKSRGGLASADELVYVNDFGADVISSSGNFVVNADILRITNT